MDDYTSEMESDSEDPEKLLNTWLVELDSLTMGLEKCCGDKMRPLSSDSDLNTPRIDSYRFSMANMEESQDVDLDAIITELTALESQYDEAIQASAKTDVTGAKEEVKSNGGRTHSPDNDSAFSDSVSLLSSESSASSGRTDLHSQVDSNSKAEKIRLALQKMKDASVKKLFIKVFSDDGSGKSLLVDESMSCGYVTRVLAEKNHRQLEPQCALVEHLTDLHMERVYEDHERLVDQLMMWTRDSKNRLVFCDRAEERTLLFERPHLLLAPLDTNTAQHDHFHNTQLLEEFFSGSGVPSVEGPLYIKTESRKGWKKFHCMLRASGLYYWPKDKAKSSSKDLICLATFDVNHVYYGVGWKKKFKSPTEFGFAIKHPCLQQPKSAKYIKYLCAEDQTTMHRWVTAIRIIKYGRELLVNYRSVVEECQLLAAAESTRTVVEGLEGETARLVAPGGPGQMSSASSDSSSGCCDLAFDSDFPSGTIKRKPPKLPLTATTRQLKEIGLGGPGLAGVPGGVLNRVDSYESLPPPPPELLMDDTDEEDNLDSSTNSVPMLPPRGPVMSQRGACTSSQVFLEDLHRVMARKWQVAQKCMSEPSVTPHQVLGFRDDLPPQLGGEVSKEADIYNWVTEQQWGQRRVVGNSAALPSLYENVYRPVVANLSTHHHAAQSAPTTVLPIAPNVAMVKRRPPPPPPPRATTTHLTTAPLLHS